MCANAKCALLHTSTCRCGHLQCKRSGLDQADSAFRTHFLCDLRSQLSRMRLLPSIRAGAWLGASSCRHLPDSYSNMSCVSPAGAQKGGGGSAGDDTCKRRSAEQRLAHYRSEFSWWYRYELEGRDILVNVLIFLPAVVFFVFQAHLLLAAGYDIAHTAQILGIPLAADLYMLVLTKVMSS